MTHRNAGLPQARRAISSADRVAANAYSRFVRGIRGIVLVFGAVLMSSSALAEHALVIQTDFGTKDGAVAAMRGVAFGVSPKIALFDLSHENTPYNIWEAAYRLKQAAPFWPEGTVFVSVVDPGVGTQRKSVVVKTK